MSLDNVRAEINAIDLKLKELLNERFECSKKVALIKQAENLPILHPTREAEILQSIKESDYSYSGYICEVYKSIMEQSRALQENILENK